MKKGLYDDLVKSIKEAGQIRKGKKKPACSYTFKPLDIKKIRRRLAVSQREFALLIGVSKYTLQNWEQGRRVPEGPARALLKVASVNPGVVMNALNS